MDHVELIVAGMLVAVAVLGALARRVGVPYPIVLVLGGLVLGFVPGLPDLELEPELVLGIFLPPLLYAAAFFANLRDMRRDVRSISLSAIGLVLVTAVVVAVVAHDLFGVPWAAAFTLGAVVSPTDPLAATAIARRLGAPRRIVTVIEGESLINDATALVIYRVAVAAAVGGSFSLAEAGARFVLTAAGGVAIGVAAGWLIGQLRRRIDDPTLETTVSLLSGYVAYLPAEELGLSGVLAAVTCGIYLGWRAPDVASAETRIVAFSVWEVLVFLLNAVLFVLIGLQLEPLLREVSGDDVFELIGEGLLVAVVVVGVRLVWSHTMPYVVRALDRRPSQRARRVGWRPRMVIAWAGLRGAVSLAAALAIPLETDSGAPFADRDLIVLATFMVILVTLVGQGLTLPWLIRRLGVRGDGVETEEELVGRRAAADAALLELDTLAAEQWSREDTVRRMRALYEYRRRRFAARAGDVDDDGIEDRSAAYQRMVHQVIGAQRSELLRLRNEGAIANEVMHRLERELDLEESRLEL